ncbi:hypothetical protein D3C72_1601150 [compost metagenome]
MHALGWIVLAVQGIECALLVDGLFRVAYEIERLLAQRFRRDHDIAVEGEVDAVADADFGLSPFRRADYGAGIRGDDLLRDAVKRRVLHVDGSQSARPQAAHAALGWLHVRRGGCRSAAQRRGVGERVGAVGPGVPDWPVQAGGRLHDAGPQTPAVRAHDGVVACLYGRLQRAGFCRFQIAIAFGEGLVGGRAGGCGGAEQDGEAGGH